MSCRYTWLDATLHELTVLLSDAVDSIRNKNSQISFAMVYPDNQGVFAMKPVGQIDMAKPCPDNGKTLASLNFVIGDFLDICVSLPQQDPVPRSFPNPSQVSSNRGYQNRVGRGDRSLRY